MASGSSTSKRERPESVAASASDRALLPASAKTQCARGGPCPVSQEQGQQALPARPAPVDSTSGLSQLVLTTSLLLAPLVSPRPGQCHLPATEHSSGIGGLQELLPPPCNPERLSPAPRLQWAEGSWGRTRSSEPLQPPQPTSSLAPGWTWRR